jgi:REP element-mobilizing transposase RayT
MAVFAKIRDGCIAISRKKAYLISCLSLMPDHLHLALRGGVDQSPVEIASSFQNNLAYLLGQKPIWKETFYVGTFGQYNLNAIRHREA